MRGELFRHFSSGWGNGQLFLTTQEGHVALDGAPANSQGLGQVAVGGSCSLGLGLAEESQDALVAAGDFDGDGDTDEGIAGEVETVVEALYAALQDYAANTAGVGIEYNAHRYPYFFDEAGERYATWTPRLLRAAYNYQYAQKDPGGFAHNGKYLLQVLYDSLQDLGADVTGMVRP